MAGPDKQSVLEKNAHHPNDNDLPRHQKHYGLHTIARRLQVFLLNHCAAAGATKSSQQHKKGISHASRKKHV